MNSPDLVVRLIDAFENAGVPYMLSGLVASSYYGGGGFKNEAQFVLQISTDPVTMTMRYILAHPAGKFQFDLFLLGPDAHDQARFERRRELSFQGTTACLPTAEDVMIALLRWSRGGTREKDAESIMTIIAPRSNQLDLTYIRGWADQHGTRALFEKLLIGVKSAG